MGLPILFARKKKFNPRQLFAALQGAWLEPVQGSIWQENTGVTPTTTGGQTLGLVLDQSQGAVLGPELVTNGDFSAGATWWTFTGSVAATGGKAVFTDASTGTSISRASVVSVGMAYLVSYEISGYVSGAIRVASGSSGYTGVTRNSNGTFSEVIIPSLAGSGNFSIGPTGSGTTLSIDNISVRQILGYHAAQSTANLRPTYQLDSNNLPLARHDVTDSLTVSLPSINVRRNLLTYSENFTNAVWPWSEVTVRPNAALAYNGTPTASKLIESSTNNAHNIYKSYAVANGSVASIYAKAAERNYLHYYHHGAAGTYIAVTFDLVNGTVSKNTNTSTAVYAPSVSIVKDGWVRIQIYYSDIGNLTAANSWRVSVCSTGTPASYSIYGGYTYQGDGVSGIYIDKAQHELGSTATDYQKITDWTSEAYSSSGSVYFATPVGMSALHNQSMATTYTLPALSTDIYSWIVVPQRLSTVLEARLERYMLRKANLTEPDYLLDDDGNQLMSDEYELLLRQ